MAIRHSGSSGETVELLTFVFYDVANDRIRGRIADACLDYGLRRVQFSVFIGPLSRNRREEIFDRLCDLLGEGVGCIVIQPLCENDVRVQLIHENLPAEMDDPIRREPAP